jgi:hypothetical protein
MVPRSTCIVLCAALAVATACRQTTPADLAVTVGESGGFTGWSTGYVLTAGGEVFRFTDRHEGDVERTRVGRLSVEERDQLWRRISSSPALDTPFPEGHGDLTRFLVVVAEGTTHRVEWTVGPPRDLEPPVVELFEQCRDILAGADVDR